MEPVAVWLARRLFSPACRSWTRWALSLLLLSETRRSFLAEPGLVWGLGTCCLPAAHSSGLPRPRTTRTRRDYRVVASFHVPLCPLFRGSVVRRKKSCPEHAELIRVKAHPLCPPCSRSSAERRGLPTPQSYTPERVASRGPQSPLCPASCSAT